MKKSILLKIIMWLAIAFWIASYILLFIEGNDPKFANYLLFIACILSCVFFAIKFF